MALKTMRLDGGGHPTGAMTWTGETQAVAFTDTATAATEITVPGRDYRFVATQACHFVIGQQGIKTPDATTADLCYYLPANTIEHIFVPYHFEDGVAPNRKLYIRVVRGGSTNGTLFISQMVPNESSRTVAPTSTTSTTTSTTSTTTSSTTTT